MENFNLPSLQGSPNQQIRVFAQFDGSGHPIELQNVKHQYFEYRSIFHTAFPTQNQDLVTVSKKTTYGLLRTRRYESRRN